MNHVISCSAAAAVIFCILLSPNSVDSLRNPLQRSSGVHRRMIKLQSDTNGDASRDNSAVADDQGKKINEMMELFVTAINEGRQEDLVKAGLNVTTLSAKAALDEKLRDPEIIANILGPMTSAEELDLKNVLRNQITLENELEGSKEKNVLSDLDPMMFAELQAEAKETLAMMKKQGSGIAALLDQKTPSNKGFGSINKAVKVQGNT